MAKPGLYANIHAKRKRIAAGSGEKMREKGAKGAPSADDFKQAAKTAVKKKKGGPVRLHVEEATTVIDSPKVRGYK